MSTTELEEGTPVVAKAGLVINGWKAMGILVTVMLFISGASIAVPIYRISNVERHAEDKTIHENGEIKMTRIYRIVDTQLAQERANFREIMELQMELILQELQAHETLGGHKEMEERALNFERRLSKAGL